MKYTAWQFDHPKISYTCDALDKSDAIRQFRTMGLSGVWNIRLDFLSRGRKERHRTFWNVKV